MDKKNYWEKIINLLDGYTEKVKKSQEESIEKMKNDLVDLLKEFLNASLEEKEKEAILKKKKELDNFFNRFMMFSNVEKEMVFLIKKVKENQERSLEKFLTLPEKEIENFAARVIDTTQSNSINLSKFFVIKERLEYLL